MKKINFMLFLGLLSLFACRPTLDPSDQAKEETPENTTVFEDYSVTDANKSVEAFGLAIKAFEKADKQQVAQHLKAGIDALANEGKTLTGEAKSKLENAIRRLEKLRKDVESGDVATVDSMMDAIAEAEADVPHKLLSGYTEVEVEAEQ